MKRIFKTATALVIAGALSASMFAFAACSDDEEHTHTYGEAVWTWSTDYSSAKATFTCTDDDDTQEVTATVTSETTTEATCTEGGEVTYTATAEFEGQTYTDTKTDTITAKGHTYSQATYDETDGKWYEVCSVCGTTTTEEITSDTLVNYTLLADSSTSLVAAISVGTVNIELADDVTITAADLNSALAGTSVATVSEEGGTTVATNDVVIDVAGNTLTVSGSDTVQVTDGNSLTIKDSTNTSGSASTAGNTLVLTNTTSTKSNLSAATGSSITLENMIVSATGSVLFPCGDSAEANVINSKIVTTGAYCIGTNAATTDNYNVVITVKNSYLETAASDYDSCTVMINVAGTLNITDSEIVGQRQGVMVRAGTAVLKNTTVSCSMDASKITTTFANRTTLATAWGSGNEVSMGAVVVGNNTERTYCANADLTIDGCTFSYDITGTDAESYAYLEVGLFLLRSGSTNASYVYNTAVTISDTSTATTIDGYVVKVLGTDNTNSVTCTLTGYSGTVYTSYSNGWVEETTAA